MCSGRVGSSCSTSGTRVLVTRSLVLYVCFVDRSLYFLLLSIVLFVFSEVLVTRSLVLYVCFVDKNDLQDIHIKLKIE
jgi:hypothetical protein